jgi:cell division protein FtsB
MSATAGSTARRPVVRPASPAPAAAPRATALRLVPQRRSSAPRAPFITVVVLLLAGGLLGLLVLNTVLAQDAFALHALTKEQKELVDREQTLEREVETLRTPRNLAERARELGMVQGSTPAFLRLPEGTVLGAEVPAAAPDGAPVDGADGLVPEDDAAESDDEAGDASESDDEAADDEAAGDASEPDEPVEQTDP